jgi:hypothetical protein
MWGWLNSFVRDFLGPLVRLLMDKRIRALAEYAKTACANLEGTEFSSGTKRQIVLDALKYEAQQLKIEVSNHILAAILEAALARVRDQ